MDDGRKNIVKSILKFLRDEMNGTNLDSEQKECLDVARQCLENTYEITNSLDFAIDLLTLFDVKKAEVTSTLAEFQNILQ